MTDVDTDIEQVTKQKTQIPKKFNVVLLNDDFTPIDFVVDILINIFNHSMEKSMAITLEIHNSDSGIAGTYSKEIATEKVREVNIIANVEDFPLQTVIRQA